MKFLVLPIFPIFALMTSCSMFSSSTDEKVEAKPVEKIIEKEIVYVSLPGGEPSMPSDTTTGSSLHTRPGLRDPDLGSALPLNLDGSMTQREETKPVDPMSVRLGGLTVPTEAEKPASESKEAGAKNSMETVVP